MNPRLRTLDYQTRCGRCGEMIEPGNEIVYVAGRGANPLLQGKKNPRVFHVDTACGKEKK